MKKLLVGICTLFLLTGCFNSKNTSSKDLKVDLNDAKGIAYDYVLTSDSIILSITNETKDLIDFINVDLAIYDEDNKLIRVEKQSIRNLEAKKTNIVKVYYKNTTAKKEEKKPARIEVAVSNVNYETEVETSYVSKVEATVSKTKTEGEFTLNVKNNSGVTLDDLNVAVVFYKNSKIVDIYEASAQKVDSEYNTTIYLPVQAKDDGTASYIKYDDMKVIVNNASVYNQ